MTTTLPRSRARTPVPLLTRPLYDRSDAQTAWARLTRPNYWPTGATLKAMRRRWGLNTRQMARVLNVGHEVYQLAEQAYTTRLERGLAIRARSTMAAILQHALRWDKDRPEPPVDVRALVDAALREVRP